MEKAATVELFKLTFAYKSEDTLKDIKSESLHWYSGYVIDSQICYFYSQDVDVAEFLAKVVTPDAAEKAPDHDLPWKLIAKKMKTRDKDSCRIKW